MATLWIVCPVYNEEESLTALVEEWLPVFRREAGKSFVFCLINDGSTDRSLAVLKDLAGKYPEVRVIDKTNGGHGSACLLGYRTALRSGADWIFQIDSDGQCDPSDFAAFWRSRAESPVHYGRRRRREDGLVRSIISRILSLAVFLLSGRWIADANVPYRLMSRKALRSALERIPDYFRLVHVLLSLLHVQNYSVQWHEIRFRRRSGRQSPVKLGSFVREAMFFFRDYLRWGVALCRNRIHESVHPGGRTDYLMAAVLTARLLLAAVAAYYLIVFLVLAVMRTGILVEYDWLESAHLAQVHRFLAGLPLYPAPTLEYIPLIYGPFYVYVASVFSFLFGESYTALRVVSLAATIGTEIMTGLLVWRMTASMYAGWIAAGLFAGMYGITGFCYDTGRIDPLAVFLISVLAYFLWQSRGPGRPALACATAAAVLAVLTKQTALAPVVALSVWSTLAGKGRGRLAGALCLGAVLLTQGFAVWRSDGWFFYYLYQLPRAHPIANSGFDWFFLHEFLPLFGAGIVVAFAAVMVLLRADREKHKTWFFLFFLAAMAAASMAPRLKIGGNLNNYLFFAFALAVGAGLLAGSLMRKRGWWTAVAMLLLLGNSAAIFYLPKQALPAQEMIETMRMRIEVSRHLPGPVFAPTESYLSVIAGKNPSAFWGAVIDVWLASGKVSERLNVELRQALAERRFGAVVLRDGFFMQQYFPYDILKANYRIIGRLEGLPLDWPETARLSVYVPVTEGSD